MNIYNLNHEQKQIKEQFTRLLKVINDKLQKSPLLTDLNLKVIIAGGAVRELLLDNIKEIKDIDIIISYAFKSNEILTDKQLKDISNIPKHIHAKAVENIENKILKYNLVDSKNSNNTNTDTFYNYYGTIVSTLIQEALKDGLSIHKIFKDERLTDSSEEYRLSFIDAIFKGKFENYDIDIILTPTDAGDFVRNKFDFNICKVGLFLNSDNNSDFLTSPDFFEYVNDKRITFETQSFSYKEVYRSIHNHLPRIIKKYPDYKEIILKNITSKDYNIMLESLLLEQKLSENKAVKSTNKIPKI